jgi:hypothetical protein
MRSCAKCLGALTAILLLAGPVLADDVCMTGKVKSVNADNKSMVMTVDGKDHTLKLDDKTTINRGGKDTKGGLKAGDNVSICYDSGVVNDTARYVLVQEGDFKNCVVMRVTVKGYEDAAKKVTVTETASKKDFTFNADDAKVRLNGQDSQMKNIKIGDPAVIVVDQSQGANKLTLKALLAWSR